MRWYNRNDDLYAYNSRKNKSNYEIANQNFYEAISLLKEEKYNEAYQLSNNIEDAEEQRTIRNIIAYSYLIKITNCLSQCSILLPP